MTAIIADKTTPQPGGGLRGASFRALWAAVSTSQVGSTVTAVLIPLIAVVNLGASASDMGWLVAVGMTPAMLVRLPVAAWSDAWRGSRVALMVVCNIVQAAVIGLIPLLWWQNVLTFPILISLVGVASLLTGLYASLSSPVLVEVVAREHLVSANGKINASRSVADVTGPAIGSALLTFLAAPLVVLIDSLSFLLSALLLGRVRVRKGAEEATAPQGPAAGSRSAWRDTTSLAHRLLQCSGVQAMLVVAFVNGIVDTVLVLFMVDVLKLPSPLIGLLLGLGAVGGIAGGMLVGRVLNRYGPGLTLVAGVVSTVFSLSLLPFGVAGVFGAAGVVVFELAGSFGGTLMIATVFGTLQGAAPDGKVARVMALAGMSLQVAGLVGVTVGGVLGTVLGLRPTLVGALALLVLALTPQILRWHAAGWSIDTEKEIS
ncbi:MFS transporter [Catellatospora sichuanensis]|uniref:MFS transporter n=1 Tax=Catellatospora sichuanensis TaxID=1969805 RepID=UPI0011840919|nr:MFS transporter [Catellatospora sichuanensis]